jgi:hypothetical protein
VSLNIIFKAKPFLSTDFTNPSTTQSLLEPDLKFLLTPSNLNAEHSIPAISSNETDSRSNEEAPLGLTVN